MLSSQAMLQVTRALRVIAPARVFRIPTVRAFSRSAFVAAKVNTAGAGSGAKKAVVKIKASALAKGKKPSAGRTKAGAAKRKPAGKKGATKAQKRVVKAKAKTVKKKVALTDVQKQEQKQKRVLLKLRQEFRHLISKSLIREEPGAGRVSTWTVFVSPSLRGSTEEKGAMVDRFRDASRRYSALGPHELEKLRQSAVAEKGKAEKQYQDWVRKHTPLQILEANHARRLMNRRINDNRTGFATTRRSVGRITDSRQVKGPRAAMAMYYKNLPGLEGGLNAYFERWKSLNESEKQEYMSLARQDRQRFEQEFEKTYGRKYAPKA